MILFSMLLIAILTTVSKVTSLHCSDQQLPASGDDDLQQVTALQYCLVDNCTIMMIDTREELDIVYTTDILIVTAPTDGRTSTVIAKLENEMFCALTNDNHQLILVVSLSMGSLVVLVSGYTAAMHIIVKKLREKIFGKLLMFYSLSVIGLFLDVMILLVTHLSVKINLWFVCHSITIVFMIVHQSEAVLATCLLHHLAYLMYRSYWLKPEMSGKTSKYFYKCYMAYVLGTPLLSGFLIILYDMVTGNGRNLLLPNGHCAIPTPQTYDPMVFISFTSFINKIAQAVMFFTYLYYAYNVYDSLNGASQLTSQLHRITIAMGAAVGLTHFVYLLQVVFGLNIQPLLNAMFLIQQLVIMSSYLSPIKKIQKLCREYKD